MQKRSLAFKIYFVLFLMTISACTVVVIGLYELNKLNTIIQRITQTYVTNLESVAKLNSDFKNQVIDERSYLLATDDQRITYLNKINEKEKEIISSIKSLKQKLRDEQLQVLSSFENDYIIWQKNFNDIQMLIEKKQINEAIILSKTTGQSVLEKATNDLQKLNLLTTTYLEEYQKQAEKDYRAAKLQLILISSALTLIAFIISALLIKSITKNIKEIILNLSENSFEVTAASEQINRTSQELSAAALEQSSSIEETSAAVTEMNSMLEKSLDSAELSFKRSNEALNKSLEGKAIMEDVAEIMKEIDHSNEDIVKAVEKSNKRIEEVTQIIANISEKTKIINEIVFQTKLLSFNASVEAARANEHGRGFAVVAEEIGNLAALSGKSADEITRILNDSIPQVKNIIETSQKEIQAQILLAKNVTKKGVEISDNSIEKLNEIFRINEELNHLAENIATSSKEQALGINETNIAMEQIHKATLINTNASHESSQASLQLNKEAKNLQQTILKLEEIIMGNSKHDSEENISENLAVLGDSKTPLLQTGNSMKAS